MIAFLAALVGGCVIGFTVGRPGEKRARCGAWTQRSWERQMFDTSRESATLGRCPERVDPRCQAGNCTKHCRAADRCNGVCLKEIV